MVDVPSGADFVTIAGAGSGSRAGSDLGSGTADATGSFPSSAASRHAIRSASLDVLRQCSTMDCCAIADDAHKINREIVGVVLFMSTSFAFSPGIPNRVP